MADALTALAPSAERLLALDLCVWGISGLTSPSVTSLFDAGNLDLVMSIFRPADEAPLIHPLYLMRHQDAPLRSSAAGEDHLFVT